MMKCVVLSLVALSFQALGAGYKFLLEGKEYQAKPQPVFGSPGSPAMGDVLWVSGFPVVLAGPGKYEFRMGNDQGTILLGRLPGEGVEKPVGVKVYSDYVEDKAVLLDPLSGMTPETKAGLRAVVLEKMPGKPAEALQGVDWSNAALIVSENYAGKDEETLGELPARLNYLGFNLRRSPNFTDISSLSKATGLLWLQLDSFMTVNSTMLAGMTNLRNLDASGTNLVNIEALAGLKELRELDLSGVEELRDLRVVSSMSELRLLNVAHTQVASLGPLAGLGMLEEVDADETAVTDLPAGAAVPSLKRITLLSAPVQEDKAEQFRNELPACRVDSSWHAMLVKELKVADRLRVRSGGTCHRDLAEEKTLFEISDPAEIQRLVALWKVEDKESGFHCMCCGEPSLEFYKGDKLITTLGIHHGSSLRWPEGWPGDAKLTTVASDSICDFLARNGVDEPKKELEESRKSEAAYNRLMSAYSQLAEESVLKQIYNAFPQVDRAHEMAVEAWPDPQERAARLFSLYGALPDSTWRLSTGIDGPLRDGLLAKVDAKVALELVKRKDAPDQLLQGLSRWAFFGKEGEAFLKALEGESLHKLGAWALAHTREDNREEALHALASRLDDPLAMPLLLDFLASKIESRKAAGDAAEEPDGGVTYLPHQDTPPEGAGDKALCAWLLSKHQVAEAKPLIGKLLAGSTGPDKEAYEKSLERYDSK